MIYKCAEALSYTLEPQNIKRIASYFKTVDHKRIGRLYILFGIFSAYVGTVLSAIIRYQLSYQILGDNYHLYNVTITLHAIFMIFMFVMPVLIGGYGNYIVPLELGLPEVAFPRLNNVSF